MDETMGKIIEINPMIKKAVEQECMFTQEDVDFIEQFRREEATNKEKIRVVLNMYKNKFDIETICLALNLSQKDVQKILKKNNKGNNL